MTKRNREPLNDKNIGLHQDDLLVNLTPGENSYVHNLIIEHPDSFSLFFDEGFDTLSFVANGRTELGDHLCINKHGIFLINNLQARKTDNAFTHTNASVLLWLCEQAITQPLDPMTNSYKPVPLIRDATTINSVRKINFGGDGSIADDPTGVIVNSVSEVLRSSQPKK